MTESAFAILLVEDEERTSSQIQRAFAEMLPGQPVVLAKDMVEAVKAVDENPVAIVVTDMRYPDMGGSIRPDSGLFLYQYLRRGSQGDRDIRFVTMSSDPKLRMGRTVHDAEEVFAAVDVAFFHKLDPEFLPKLVGEVKRLLKEIPVDATDVVKETPKDRRRQSVQPLDNI